METFITILISTTGIISGCALLAKTTYSAIQAMLGATAIFLVVWALVIVDMLISVVSNVRLLPDNAFHYVTTYVLGAIVAITIYDMLKESIAERRKTNHTP